MAETAAERGYAATTVAQVIERAGVSSTTYYELFRDKEDCFLAVVREIIAQATVVVTEAYGRQGEDLDLVADAIRSLLGLFAEQPAHARLLFLECRSSTPRALELYMSGARALLTMLGRGWAADPPSGVSPAIAARVAFGAAEALIRNEIAHGRTERLSELVPQIVYCAVIPFRGLDEAIARSKLARDGATVGG